MLLDVIYFSVSSRLFDLFDDVDVVFMQGDINAVFFFFLGVYNNFSVFFLFYLCACVDDYRCLRDLCVPSGLRGRGAEVGAGGVWACGRGADPIP